MLDKTRRQLAEYFAGERREFDLPLGVEGTAFQRQVWGALAFVGYGETVTYAELARAVGRPGAARAVGAALASNPLPVVVPCHRVIGARGDLRGLRRRAGPQALSARDRSGLLGKLRRTAARPVQTVDSGDRVAGTGNRDGHPTDRS